MLIEVAEASRLRGLPVFVTHGVQDWMFPVDIARQAARALAAAGADVTYAELPDLSHCYPAEMNTVLLDWLDGERSGGVSGSIASRVSSADPIAMTPDWSTLLLLIPIGFLGSFVYGVTGFGSGLITVPLAAALVDLPFALAVFCLIDTLNVARVWLARPQSVDRDEARRLLPDLLVRGVAVVFLPPTRLPLAGVMTAFGVFLLGYAIYGLALAEPAMPTRWAYLAGFTGGLTSAMFGAGGPPFAM